MLPSKKLTPTGTSNGPLGRKIGRNASFWRSKPAPGIQIQAFFSRSLASNSKLIKVARAIHQLLASGFNMMVNLQSLLIIQMDSFKKEIGHFPAESREDIFALVFRFLAGEKLNTNDFKIFKIDKNTKILEFKVKDAYGNWRAVSTFYRGKYLVFIYAFHKKSQSLQEKEKNIIRQRIKRISL